jgi:hypothetical protein
LLPDNWVIENSGEKSILRGQFQTLKVLLHLKEMSLDEKLKESIQVGGF